MEIDGCTTRVDLFGLPLALASVVSTAGHVSFARMEISFRCGAKARRAGGPQRPGGDGATRSGRRPCRTAPAHPCAAGAIPPASLRPRDCLTRHFVLRNGIAHSRDGQLKQPAIRTPVAAGLASRKSATGASRQQSGDRVRGCRDRDKQTWIFAREVRAGMPLTRAKSDPRPTGSRRLPVLPAAFVPIATGLAVWKPRPQLSRPPVGPIAPHPSSCHRASHAPHLLGERTWNGQPGLGHPRWSDGLRPDSAGRHHQLAVNPVRRGAAIIAAVGAVHTARTRGRAKAVLVLNGNRDLRGDLRLDLGGGLSDATPGHCGPRPGSVRA